MPAAGIVLARDGRLVASFHFDDRMRPGAERTVATLRGIDLPMEILSGDRNEAVRRIAGKLGIPFRADVAPAEKVDRVTALEASGHKVLMVGDGINDAPALAAAHASMAPATAADVGRNAADLVFLRETLEAVPDAIRIARSSGMLVRQNLGLAILYNLVALPTAVLGYATPLVAAIAMSSSSVIVVANALRLARSPRDGARRRAASVRAARLAGGTA